jgi:lysozyme
VDTSKLITELERDESLRLKPYRDSVRTPEHPNGILTIGIGRNLEAVGIGRDEAYLMLHNDIDRAVADVEQKLPWWSELDDDRQRVIVNMAFNMDIRRLLGFAKFLAAAQAGRYEEAAAEMLNSSWARQVGVRAQRLAELMRGAPRAAGAAPAA